jgi:hypothetical protein
VHIPQTAFNIMADVDFEGGYPEAPRGGLANAIRIDPSKITFIDHPNTIAQRSSQNQENGHGMSNGNDITVDENMASLNNGVSKDANITDPKERNLPSHMKSLNKPHSPIHTYSPPPPDRSKYATLRKNAHAFACAFSHTTADASSFIERFLTHHGAGPRITEHAPSYASKPFPHVNRSFQGAEECLEYLKLKEQNLKTLWFEGGIPADECILVDPECWVNAGDPEGPKGSCVLIVKMQTEHLESGWRWNESVVWKLSGYDEDGKWMYWVCVIDHL